jgi:hypothetical protein
VNSLEKTTVLTVLDGKSKKLEFGDDLTDKESAVVIVNRQRRVQHRCLRRI